MSSHPFARRAITLVLIVVLLTTASTMFLATTFGAPDVCISDRFFPGSAPTCLLDVR